MDDYGAWQTVLADAFFDVQSGPTVLFLDVGAIAKLRPELEDPTLNFVAAVRNRLRLGRGRGIFQSVMYAYRTWQVGAQAEAPPILPLLGLTVLAATKMRTDAEARSTNFYIRLAQILLPDATDEEITKLRNDLRTGDAFLDVVEMWSGLDSWVEAQQGRVGVSTIRTDPRLQRIGYPLSQALLRHGDRVALTRFFHALDFYPASAPEAAVLVGALDIWTVATQNKLSDTFMRSLADTDTRPLLASVVEAHAQAWDGNIITNDGNQRIEVKIGVDLASWQIQWLFPRPPELVAELSLRGPEGVSVQLAPAEGWDYLDVDQNLAVRSNLVLAGMQLQGRDHTAEFPATQAVFLRADPQTGGWSSVPGLVPFEEHLVLLQSAHVDSFRRVLTEAAAPGWKINPQRKSALLPGYALFEGVQFSASHALDQALKEIPGLRGVGIATEVVPIARFVRGLPIARGISRTHYLLGGAPDLLIPSGANGETSKLTIGGRHQEIRANGFPLELRRIVSGSGLHQVDVDGRAFAFTVLEEDPSPLDPKGTGEIGWDNQGIQVRQSDAAIVKGAVVTHFSGKPPVLARRGRDATWLLLDEGRNQQVFEPNLPAFLSTTDSMIHLPHFEINPPKNARWVAQRRGVKWTISEIGSDEPMERTVEFEVLGAWRRACINENGAQLWALQLEMASGRS